MFRSQSRNMITFNSCNFEIIFNKHLKDEMHYIQQLTFTLILSLHINCQYITLNNVYYDKVLRNTRIRVIGCSELVINIPRLTATLLFGCDLLPTVISNGDTDLYIPPHFYRKRWQWFSPYTPVIYFSLQLTTKLTPVQGVQWYGPPFLSSKSWNVAQKSIEESYKTRYIYL